MKVFREINNITAHYFPLTGNDLVVTTFSNMIKRIGADSWEHSFSGIKYPKLVYRDNLYVQQREEGSLKEGTGCLDLKTGKQKELNFLQSSILLTSLIQDSKVLARHKDQNRKKTIQLIDLSLLKTDWEIDVDLERVWGFDIGVLGQHRGKSEIVFVDIRDGRIIWNYDLSKLGTWQDYDGSEKQTQISKVLGVFEGNIYIYLNSGKILILNVMTGELLRVLKNDKHPKFDNFGNSIELDLNSGKLIQLASQDLIEVNLKSLEVEVTAVEDMKSFGLENFSPIVFDSEHIYFSDKNKQTIGALNRNTHKLDWTYQFLQNERNDAGQVVYGKEMKLNENRLYVLDNKNTLHVFDKR